MGDDKENQQSVVKTNKMRRKLLTQKLMRLMK